MVIEAALWSGGIVGGTAGAFVLLNHLGEQRLKRKGLKQDAPTPPTQQTKVSTKKVEVDEKYDFIRIGNTKNPKLMPTAKGTFTRNQISYERLIQMSNCFLENMSKWQGFLIKGEFDENTNIKIMSLGHSKYIHIKYACNNGILLYCDIDSTSANDKIVVTINGRVYQCLLKDYWRVTGVHEIKIMHTNRKLINEYDVNYHVDVNMWSEMKSTYECNTKSWTGLIDKQPTTPLKGKYVPLSTTSSMIDDFYKPRSSDSDSSSSFDASSEFDAITKTERMFESNDDWLRATNNRVNRNKKRHSSLDLGSDIDYDLLRLLDDC